MLNLHSVHLLAAFLIGAELGVHFVLAAFLIGAELGVHLLAAFLISAELGVQYSVYCILTC